MAQNENAEKIGAAWALHRQGKNDKAIEAFYAVARADSNSYDALYGLGLAQRAAGMKDGAVKSFQDSLSIVNKLLMTHPGEDRYEIMQRMISQRLAELGSPATGTHARA
jgi:tetratricopeptide (TPR) repeat protein